MERIRPPQEDPSKSTPLFYCSSIDDLLSSRSELITQVQSWKKNEASLRTKLTNPYAMDSKIALFLGVHDKTHARVYIPKVKHLPAADENFDLKSDEITIFDGIELLKVKLPIRYLLEKENNERQRQGIESIYLEQLRGPWNADVHLHAAFSKNDRFTVLDIRNGKFQAKDSIPERKKFATNIPLPRSVKI